MILCKPSFINIIFGEYLQSPSRKDRSIEMFINVRNALIQNKCLAHPQVYVRSEVDKAVRDKVKSIIERHDGEITGDRKSVV